MIAPSRAPVSGTERTYAATIYAPDGVLLAVVADCERARTDRVVDFIRERCDDVLWPGDAARVHALIADGRFDAAISAYFSRVGKRWDAERLELSY